MNIDEIKEHVRITRRAREIFKEDVREPLLQDMLADDIEYLLAEKKYESIIDKIQLFILILILLLAIVSL